ncbi:hypothetical protein [Nonomuraea sp. NPDC003754]
MGELAEARQPFSRVVSSMECAQSDSDLLTPEYKGQVAIKNPTSSGTGQAMVVAAAIANGGSVDNLAPAYDYFRKLTDAGNISAVKVRFRVDPDHVQVFPQTAQNP